MGIRAWREYGKPQRIEIYSRWSFYLMTAFAPLSLLPLADEQVTRQSSQLAAILLSVLVLLCAVASVPLIRAALACHVRGGPLPVRLMLSHAALTQAAVWLPLLIGTHHTHEPTALLVSSEILLVLWIVAPAIALPPLRLVPWALAMVTLAVPPAVIASGDPATALGQLIGGLLGLSACAVSCRCSAWMVKVAWDLDGARETQARLAVAEERLRFSRDLHDVLGRNLTTMALKA
jgi:two-component system sensor histidine kinase DesK